MIGIVRIALRQPYTFVVMALLILIIGVASALRTPTDIFPNIRIPVICVVFSYTGLPPDDMAGRVVSFYERAVTNSVNNIEHIESQSIPNYGVIKLFFQPSVNIQSAEAEVASMSQTVLKQFPPGMMPPTILVFDASSVPILQLALSSDTLSDTALFDNATSFIRPQLASVAGASIPLPYGGKVRQVQADLDQQALHTYGLSANDVITALSQQNMITPVGTQKIGTYEYTVQLNDSPATIAAFNDLPVKTVNGAVIAMRDVAFVHDGHPPQLNIVRVDGKNAVLLSIVKSGSASTLTIINQIKALLPRVAQTMPPGLRLSAVGDQSPYVTSAITGVLREALIAGLLTAAMILIFIGSWRSTLIIVVSIPLAILSSITVLSALGETINVMTLGGLALAVGILVDDATVTIENINRHLDLGEDVETSILHGAHEIMLPATVSLLCITTAFMPMFALGGIAGYLFRPQAEAFIFALAASYLLTYTLVPTMANYLLVRPSGHDTSGGNRFSRFQQTFELGFERVRTVYAELLQLSLRRSIRLVCGFLGFSLLSFGLMPFLGQNFFPTVDSGQIKLHVRAPVGTRIEETTKLCDRVNAVVRTVIPATELAGIVDNIGSSISPINTAYNNSGSIGVEDADILITLKPSHGATADYIKRLREQLPRQLPGATFSFLPADMVSQILNFGTPATIDLQIAGNRLAENRVYANALLARIRHVPGIADARIQQAFSQPTLHVETDRTLAGLVGLSERDAATAMLTTLAGSTQTYPTYWLNPANGGSYPVAIQTPQYDLDSMSGLLNIPLTAGALTQSSQSAASQLLGGLATITRVPASAVASHYNVRPVIDIYATTQDRDLGGVASDIRALMAMTARDLPRGSEIDLRGQVSTMNSAYQQLFTGLGFAIILIYLLLVVNFQSWRDPFIIVAALPTALAGIVWMLFSTGTTISVPALTGAIMCMGVATANSNLVIAFARERMAEGDDAVTAAMKAGATRFRPVLMTALAMIIGMVPMALEPGQNTPLGRAVIGGLLFATCATLFLVPILFSLIHAKDTPPRIRCDSTFPFLT
ncbi:efflux RND transporter permease subunit [Acetobacter sp.]|jgi:multidrug efflux pump subunit AcrB|uniref:efflux RND transporter permease subunit n=1 Tax=Acetobacter sp. TaxID=440 RepID=UPI0025B880E6|nr:efflux RND transporter permease subunit [Acetobacter sp.]MCH4092008.1 efflux RND transporter permease subunit [Acetobacter sp.]MCI1300738.1 efflux RND transporter permease subunit [Acetobacter sp.]MCI1317510.1 efflux RND transporter permease subunit [Acetobacter sp.]